MKVVLILSLPFVLFYVYNILADFNFYADRNLILDDLEHLKFREQDWLSRYVRKEYVFSGVTAFISSVLGGLHLMRLLWRQINKK